MLKKDSRGLSWVAAGNPGFRYDKGSFCIKAQGLMPEMENQEKKKKRLEEKPARTSNSEDEGND